MKFGYFVGLFSAVILLSGAAYAAKTDISTKSKCSTVGTQTTCRGFDTIQKINGGGKIQAVEEKLFIVTFDSSGDTTQITITHPDGKVTPLPLLQVNKPTYRMYWYGDIDGTRQITAVAFDFDIRADKRPTERKLSTLIVKLAGETCIVNATFGANAAGKIRDMVRAVSSRTPCDNIERLTPK